MSDKEVFNLSSEYYTPYVQVVPCRLAFTRAEGFKWSESATAEFWQQVHEKKLKATVKECNEHVAIIDLQTENGKSMVQLLQNKENQVITKWLGYLQMFQIVIKIFILS